MFSKIEVNGDGACDLYTWLKAEQGDGADITWNFEKFLVDRTGHVVKRYPPQTTPEKVAEDLPALLGEPPTGRRPADDKPHAPR
ncbi:MAG: glutathione peroxidase [Ilumatobacteraceae bacterium]|nr:glutathione peroxidase [Ilumatobacteraceae bacterium]